MPTNIEDLRAITQAAQGGEANQGTVPERDDFFEAGIVPALSRTPGVVAKLVYVSQESDPGIDDNTVPGSNIITDVNIEHVRITGLEGVLEVPAERPAERLLNAALNHAYGYRRDHRRLLPHRAAVRNVRSRPRSTSVDRRQRDVFAEPVLT